MAPAPLHKAPAPSLKLSISSSVLGKSILPADMSYARALRHKCSHATGPISPAKHGLSFGNLPIAHFEQPLATDVKHKASIAGGIDQIVHPDKVMPALVALCAGMSDHNCFNEQLQGIFDVHGQVATSGRMRVESIGRLLP
jgi:hypothetical protein